MIRLTDFERKTSDPVTVEYISTPSGNIPVYGVSSFHSLTQLIGFGKYMNKDQCNVALSFLLVTGRKVRTHLNARLRWSLACRRLLV